MAYHPFFVILMWTSCILAICAGGWEERLAGATYLAGVELTHLVMRSLSVRFHSTENGILAVDLGALTVFTVIAVISRKNWTIWFAAFTGVIVLSHLTGADPLVLPVVYWRAISLWSYPMLVLLMAATVEHRGWMPQNIFHKYWPLSASRQRKPQRVSSKSSDRSDER